MMKKQRLPWLPWYTEYSLYWKVRRWTPSAIRSRRQQRDYLQAVNAAVPGLHFTSFGGAAPCQGYGEFNGCYVYYRFRTNIASLETYASEDAFRDMTSRGALACAEKMDVLPGETFAGHPLPVADQIELLRELVRLMKPWHPVQNMTGQERMGQAVEQIMLNRSREQ